MPNMCPRYRQHMPKIYPIYPRYPQDMSNISPSYAQDMYKVCPRYAQDSPNICLNYAWDMPMICPRYAQDLTKSQKHHSVSNIDPRDTSGSKKIEDNDDDKESFPWIQKNAAASWTNDLRMKWVAWWAVDQSTPPMKVGVSWCIALERPVVWHSVHWSCPYFGQLLLGGW